jgi:hypothetical protein
LPINRPFAHSAKISGHKGRIAIVTDAGRDAMDAAASGALMARGRMALFRLRQSFGGLAQGLSKRLA